MMRYTMLENFHCLAFEMSPTAAKQIRGTDVLVTIQLPRFTPTHEILSFLSPLEFMYLLKVAV